MTTTPRINLDYASGTPLLPEVKAAMAAGINQELKES